jgi:hypothetical protein
MPKPSIKKLIAALALAAILIVGYFLFFQKPQTAAADWWDDSWLYRQTVGITNSGTDQTDFQVMITVDTATLITANKMQSDCDDIRITDINGKLIPQWIEPTTCNTAATKIWTKVPSISTNGATVYLYYGNSAVGSKSSTADTFIREISGVRGAWDMDGSGAIATNDTLADSSGNSNTGTASNVNTTGMAYADSQYEQGVDFDGVDDYVDIANDIVIGQNSFTFEAWVKTSRSSTSQIIINTDAAVGGWNGDFKFPAASTRNGLFYITDPIYRYIDPYDDSSNTSDGEWHHFIGVCDRAQHISPDVYLDGVLTNGIGSGYCDNLTDDITFTSFLIGQTFQGLIDNVRIYNTALSQSEISDLYGTGGDRQGYVTTNYPNKSLVRKYSASVSVGSPASEERGPGPVAFWQFDEGFGQTANDSTINANNGTLGGTSAVQDSDPTWQTEDMCVSGKCLKFDGVDDYVDMGNDASLNITDAITVETWVKIGVPISSQSGEYPAIVRKGEKYNMWVSPTGDRVDFKTAGGSASFSGSLLTEGQWNHIVGTFDGSNVKIYLNSNLKDAQIGGLAPSPTDNLQIAKGGGGFFNGFIDSVKIYPYARTAAQIKADYAARGTASGSSVVISDEGKRSLSDGLVGYWKMDEASWNGTADEVVDSSGSGNDGIAVGATGIPTTGAGKFGNGGVFDGVDDYVNCGSDDSLNITDAITIEAWVRADVFISNAMTIVGAVQSNWHRVYIQSDALHYVIYDGETTWYKSKAYSFNTDQWYHIAIVGDKNSDMGYWYVNGKQIGSEPKTVWPTDSNCRLRHIGATTLGNDSFDGSIDSVRIYNRALSPGEVRDIYNFAPGPVGWWKMDEKVSGNGQTINDSSGYGNTGTTSSANGTGMDCMVQGKYGSACEFDGVDDYVNAGSGSSLDITDAITIEMWMKINTDAVARIAAKSGDGSLGWAIVYADWVDAIEWRISTTGSDWNGGVSGTNGLEINQWSHIVLSYDGAYMRVYIDGIEDTAGDFPYALTGNINIAPAATLIGVDKQNFNNFFNGSIDDVRIYNYARTQAQIMEDYSAGAGRKQPIGHWKFNEGYSTTANNSGIGGSALNGTLTNMASPATSASGWTDEGKMGKGLVFDGGNDYVEVGNATSLNITGDLTLGAWVKTNNAGTTGILGKDETDSQDKYMPYTIYLSSGKIRFMMGNSSTTYSAISNTVLDIDTWYHVVATVSGTKMQVYINGIADGSDTTFAGTRYSNSLPLYVGKYYSGGLYFNGTIDDVKIYNYALTEDDIRQEYNQGALLKLGSTGTDSSGNADDSASREYCVPGDATSCDPPVAEWNFNEGAGTTVNDISGNNNTGTWNGTGEHWDLGKVGFGGSFNGSDDYVGTTDNDVINPANITISAWIKYTYRVADAPHGIFSKWWDGTNRSYDFSVANSLAFSISDDGGVPAGNPSTDFTPYHDIWTFVTGTYDGTTQKIYINGIEKASSTAESGDIYKNNADLIIGVQPRNASPTTVFERYFNGFIDQVRIYDYARTPAQIAWDYNRGKPVAHWKFDECQGPTANDASGNGNNGTITIGATGTQDGIGTCTDGDTSNAWYNGRSGKYSSAMSFDGSDDWVEIGDITTPDALTVSAWAYRIGGTDNILVSKYHSAINKREWALGGRLFSVQENANAYNVNTLYDTNIDQPMNEWHYYVGTWESGGYAKLYIDGVLKGTANETVIDMTDTDREVMIGMWDTKDYWDGL